MCLWGGKFLLLSRTAADTKREGWLFCDILILLFRSFLYHRHVKRNYLTSKRVENSQLPEFDLSLSLFISNSSTFISLRLGDGTRGSSIRGVVPCTRCCVDAAHEEPGNGKEDNKEL